MFVPPVKGQPSYRLVVADVRAPRDGAFIAILGHYNPLTDPETVVIDEEKARHWLEQGAQPTDTAARLLAKVGIIEESEVRKEKIKAGIAAKSEASKEKAKTSVTEKPKATKEKAKTGVTEEPEASITEEPEASKAKAKTGVTEKPKATKEKA